MSALSLPGVPPRPPLPPAVPPAVHPPIFTSWGGETTLHWGERGHQCRCSAQPRCRQGFGSGCRQEAGAVLPCRGWAKSSSGLRWQGWVAASSLPCHAVG